MSEFQSVAKKAAIIIITAFMFLCWQESIAQNDTYGPQLPKSSKEVLEKANIKYADKEIEITVRSIDITKFPSIKIFIEAFNKAGQPLDTLTSENMFVYENGVQKKVTKVEKIPVSEVVAVDFVFVLDRTGSMQQHINAVRTNISRFTENLVRRGIDYRLGLVLFSDDVEKKYQPTKDVSEFLSWLNELKARGGGDEKENALEALEAATKLKYRTEASRVAVLLTDAPYHQEGENGFGVTNQTTESITEDLIEKELRVFAIVPPKLRRYKEITKKTRGTFYDISYPFSTILDNFSNQLTNLYSMTYRSDQPAVPDSIEIALFNKKKGRLVRKTIPIVDLGRKLIIENLLYLTNRFDIPDSVPELDMLAEFMGVKPQIAIMIEGHTDNIGSHRINDRLSLQRAESVKRYLVSRGVDENRIKTKGYGERRPIASNRQDFGRRLNRRTEIVIVAK